MKLVIMIALTLLVTACADRVDYEVVDAASHTYGFWFGLWHGFIVLWSFIGSLFSDNIAVYAVDSTGHFYDLGFILGIIWLRVTYHYRVKYR